MPWDSVTEALLSFLKKSGSNRIRKERPEKTDVNLDMRKTVNVTYALTNKRAKPSM